MVNFSSPTPESRSTRSEYAATTSVLLENETAKSSEPHGQTVTTASGTFLVTHAEPDSAVVRDVETSQVHTLESPPELTDGEILEATLTAEPPLEVTWTVTELDDRHTIELVDSDLEPTTHSKELAASTEDSLATYERAGRGEVHVLPLPAADVDRAADEVLTDEETIARAARLEAVRVEVRRSSEDGLVSVRYLPD